MVHLVRPVLRAPFLPPHAIWPLLNFVSPPPTQDIITNIKAMTPAVLGDWPAWLRCTPTEAVVRALTILSTSEVTAPQKHTLRLVGLIPLGCAMVPAARLFEHLPVSLAPFAFPVPKAYTAEGVFKFLRDVGVRSSPTADDLARVLADIAGPVTPGELLGVVRIMDMLADGKVGAVPRGLPVPTRDARMVPAGECFLDDAPHIARRLGSNVPVASSSVAVAVCVKFGVRRLSSAITERLVSKDTPAGDAVFVFTDELCCVLMTLVRSVDPAVAERCAALAGVSCYTVARLTTRFYLDDAPVTPVEDTNFYFDRGRKRLLLAASLADGGEDGLSALLSVAVNQVHCLRWLFDS